MQAQIETLMQNQARPARLPKPTITDVSLQLPRTAGSLKKRPTDQIKFLVFNHTAVDPSVPVERIAAAHQRRWGAILYQYLVTAEGNIVQTNALDEVVDLTQPWIAQGINIAVAGNFSADVPTDAQIKAAAQLCAWLMQEYSIPAENVKGVSEFIVTQSPGTQWLQGKRWKDTLLAAIADAQKAVDPVPTPTPGAGDTAVADGAARPGDAVAGRPEPGAVEAGHGAAERDQLQAQLNQGSPDQAQLGPAGADPDPTGADAVGRQGVVDQQVQTLTSDKTTLSQQIQTLGNDKAAL